MNERDLKDYFVNCFDHIYNITLMTKEDIEKKDTGNLEPEFLEGQVFSIYTFFKLLNETAQDYNIIPKDLFLNYIDYKKLIIGKYNKSI